MKSLHCLEYFLKKIEEGRDADTIKETQEIGGEYRREGV